MFLLQPIVLLAHGSQRRSRMQPVLLGLELAPLDVDAAQHRLLVPGAIFRAQNQSSADGRCP